MGPGSACRFAGASFMGLINPHQVVVRAVVMVSLPSSCLSLLQSGRSPGITVRGFFLCVLPGSSLRLGLVLPATKEGEGPL